MAADNAQLGNPKVVGALLAGAAAIAFGATMPFVQKAGVGLGPFSTAALLYLGAALATVPVRRQIDVATPPLRAGHLPRLLLGAVVGAAIAPALLAWGLGRTSAVHGSLLLNCEVIFTVLLAAWMHHEPIGKRMRWALLFIVVAACLSVGGGSSAQSSSLLGALAVVAAVAGWAFDNVLTRTLADFDPAAVVRTKASCGALLTTSAAFFFAEPAPRLSSVLVLLACGFGGYGLSLRLYLLAQRRVGAAKTGLVFAVAPFFGAAMALILEARMPDARTLLVAVLFVIGIALQLGDDDGTTHEPA